MKKPIVSSREVLEKRMPTLRSNMALFTSECINHFIKNSSKENTQIKTLLDSLYLLEKLDYSIQQNKIDTVDLSNDHDIVWSNIFWTDTRLAEIEDYIMPDLKDYIDFSSQKKKSLTIDQAQNLKELTLYMMDLEENPKSLLE